MVPGVGFFYAGLLRRKNGLSMIYLSVGTLAVVSFQVSVKYGQPLSVYVKRDASVVLLGIFSCIQ